jgi:EAL domain-containing protein (putative c-di-GMP-specific phosphodiesterase class I)
MILLRHQERGLLPPGAFLPLAEETGLIAPMGRWVLEESTRALRRWQDAYPELPLYVSANLSIRQLDDPEIVEQVRDALAVTGVTSDRFVLEITESVLADESEAPRTRLERLRALGVRLAVDDFGTGYSALGYLKTFPFDIVKVDRSFVRGLGRDRGDSAIVSAVLGMAKALGMEVVAEGIETEQQLACLNELGAAYGQGFYFARPGPV